MAKRFLMADAVTLVTRDDMGGIAVIKHMPNISVFTTAQ
jgi:hypothetical protein